MSQQPDKLFSEKLRNFQKPAPVAAWDRIEAKLEKKTKPGFAWWHIAASIAFFAAIGYVYWSHNTGSSGQHIANGDVPASTDVTASDNNQKAKPEIIEKPQIAAADNFKSTEKQQHDAPAMQKPATKLQPIAQPLPIRQEEGIDAEPAYSDNVASVDPRLQHEAQQVEEKKVSNREGTTSMKFTITANETDKYLNKSALAQATGEDQKASTFKKLLVKASDLKSNQDPFGDLRDKKNEILALNFKNDKRGQNK